MQDYQQPDEQRPLGQDTAGVTYFASQVVSLLAERSARSTAEPLETLVTGLIRASQSGTKEAFAELLNQMRKSRVSVAALADIYIPLAARKMGVAWEDDEMSWLDVSIGVGRLQSLLREIGTAWAADQAGDAGHGTILMIIPDREQHTLGPMVAMGQMRRYGVSVCLRIAPSLEELRGLVTSRAFDGIMISVATVDKLESVRKTIKFLKTLTAKPIPVVVGGAVMSKIDDAVPSTGADFSSNDIGAALEVVGLKFDSFCILKRA